MDVEKIRGEMMGVVDNALARYIAEPENSALHERTRVVLGALRYGRGPWCLRLHSSVLDGSRPAAAYSWGDLTLGHCLAPDMHTGDLPLIDADASNVVDGDIAVVSMPASSICNAMTTLKVLHTRHGKRLLVARDLVVPLHESLTIIGRVVGWVHFDRRLAVTREVQAQLDASDARATELEIGWNPEYLDWALT